jgi:hypothetical protein
MKHADYAWAALVAGIVAYEAACPPVTESRYSFVS